jgi:hypothetical protein
MNDKALTVIDGEIVDKGSGEIVKRDEFQGYVGVAAVAVTAPQAEALMAQFKDEDHDILPTGEVYVSQVHVRRKLNEAFRPGGWALVPRGPFAKEGDTVCREYALVGPGGVFLSEAIGEADYQPNNDRMSYASACEAAKSNALTRCCKDLGVASECWDKRFCDRWKADHAVSVWRRDAKKKAPQWRRKDAAPFYDETGVAGPRTQGAPAAGPTPVATAKPTTPTPPASGDAPACPLCATPGKPQAHPVPGKTHYCPQDGHAF